MIDETPYSSKILDKKLFITKRKIHFSQALVMKKSIGFPSFPVFVLFCFVFFMKTLFLSFSSLQGQPVEIINKSFKIITHEVRTRALAPEK